MAAVDTLSGLQWLALVHPAADAAPAVVADWYEAKAEILDELEHHDDAVVARAHAAALAGLPSSDRPGVSAR